MYGQQIQVYTCTLIPNKCPLSRTIELYVFAIFIVLTYLSFNQSMFVKCVCHLCVSMQTHKTPKCIVPERKIQGNSIWLQVALVLGCVCVCFWSIIHGFHILVCPIFVGLPANPRFKKKPCKLFDHYTQTHTHSINNNTKCVVTACAHMTWVGRKCV